VPSSSPPQPEPAVIGLFGPTASGKSAVAAAIAARTPADLISADSAQLYRGLPILTNQSPAALVAIWDLDHEASVAEYQLLAHEVVDTALGRGRTPIVVGGTGLYFRAALGGLDVPPAPEPGARARWQRVYDEEGADAAQARLAELDPAAAETVHPNDRRRVVRALELAEAGASLSPERDRLWSDDTRHPTLFVGLDVPREELDRRIAERTRRMLGRGVVDEVRAALAGEISATARTIHGLREFAELPPAEAAEAYDARVRRYAAYQRKWMRRIPGIRMVDATRPPGAVADEILALS
jgi:tRNA dimethylallyltransferase